LENSNENWKIIPQKYFENIGENFLIFDMNLDTNVALNHSPKGEGGILFYLCPSFRPSKIFLVAFFSTTIDGRNLIFGHKLHIVTPYRGKRFYPKTVERNSDNTRFNKNSSNSKTVC
jgi:hypothetical protein